MLRVASTSSQEATPAAVRRCAARTIGRFHAKAYAPEIELPIIEDTDTLQLAYMSVAQQLVSKKIDASRAKVLLQAIACAAANLHNYGS